jgi:AcrR family transcriptional regulator
MPKRDLAHMEGQRSRIAKAAFECLMERGVYETSVRDICMRADLSVGAFYTHFRDKNEAILAACEFDREQHIDELPAATWDSYANGLRTRCRELGKPQVRARLRLSYQFIAELTQLEGNLPGTDTLFATHLLWFRNSLDLIRRRGDITLPLGLEKTTGLHTRLYYGTVHALMCNHDLDSRILLEELIEGMAVIAGLKLNRSRKSP